MFVLLVGMSLVVLEMEARAIDRDNKKTGKN